MKESVTKADVESVRLIINEHLRRQEALTARVEALTATVETLIGNMQAFDRALKGTIERFEGFYETLSASHAELSNEFRGALNGFEGPEGGAPADESDEQRATRVGLVARVSDIEVLVRGRNRSAPVKRNMTDADAVRVLTGDVKDLGHKEAGEVVGLTYAQVYSCRMEYTFKHVHKDLRQRGWRNVFVK